ncbi:DUF4021 domain-containing protein [Alkalicoccobacillus porphyridii]|uniref:DUF4021 domain-containing protein n=1 Tax=Alkalicoccobacillus porphyridii TaxID=2597270 RepID=A0A554A1V2_9BACI|nr:DUF4021 domain-containing protein [Alkalicoccobacillus porphyridii]TSB47671.1 DUF4021 domain-containing protein [Alkalicoccobacillus porphyridii]
MRDQKKEHEDQAKNEKQSDHETNVVDLDPEEQAMNGNYGMPETESENEQHNKE